MKITAQPVTDSLGHQPVCGNIFLEDLKAHPLGETAKEVVWREKLELKEYVLSQLTGHVKFSLLANRLISVNKYPPTTRVRAGSTASGIRIIQTPTEEFRAKKTGIFSRKL
jgi:hypothetical protein